jgi:hypothetical protein
MERMMRSRQALLLLNSCLILFCSAGQARAGIVVLDFENFATPGSAVNINPGFPYTEDDFTLTPTTNQSAVIDADYAATDMVGNSDSDFFWFATGNVITLTSNSAQPFELLDLLIGPIAGTGGGGPVSGSIVGNLFGGGLVTQNFSDLAASTLLPANMDNLESAVIRVTDFTGIDNIHLNTSVVPEPASLALWSLCGMIGLLKALRCQRLPFQASDMLHQDRIGKQRIGKLLDT